MGRRSGYPLNSMLHYGMELWESVERKGHADRARRAGRGWWEQKKVGATATNAPAKLAGGDAAEARNAGDAQMNQSTPAALIQIKAGRRYGGRWRRCLCDVLCCLDLRTASEIFECLW